MCDFPNCNNESSQQISRLSCFHTCHRLCLEKNGNSCLICKDPLLKRVTLLSDTFNSGLLDTKDNSPAINETHEQCTGQPDISSTTGRHAEFYKSHEWETLISTSFEQLVIPQPSVPHTTTREPTQTHTDQRKHQYPSKEKSLFTLWATWSPQISWLSHYMSHPIAIKLSIFSTNNTIISTTIISQPAILQYTNTFVNTSLHTSCPSFHYRHCYFLGATSFLVTVNDRRTPWEQCMHNYFPVTGQDVSYK